jgi:hypothetical protein
VVPFEEPHAPSLLTDRVKVGEAEPDELVFEEADLVEVDTLLVDEGEGVAFPMA